MCASLVFQVHQAHTSGQIRIIFHLHLDFPEIAGVSFPFQKTLPKLGVQMDTLGGFRGPPPRIPVANVRFRLGFPQKKHGSCHPGGHWHTGRGPHPMDSSQETVDNFCTDVARAFEAPPEVNSGIPGEWRLVDPPEPYDQGLWKPIGFPYSTLLFIGGVRL